MEVEATTAAVNLPWFVGWGAFSLVVAGIAQGKNHSGCLWWFLAVLFGPFALLLLLLFANEACPSCGQSVSQVRSTNLTV